MTNVLAPPNQNALAGYREDPRQYGLPIQNQYGQFEVGGPLRGHAGQLDMAYEMSPGIGDARALSRAQEAARPVLTPDLMGGAKVGMADPLTAQFEAMTALPGVGDAMSLVKMGALSLPGLISLMARRNTELGQMALAPQAQYQAGVVGSPLTRNGEPVGNAASVADDLPMDEASRMARQDEWGDLGVNLVHGTDEDIKKFNFDMAKSEGDAVFLTDSPYQAGSYTTRNGGNLMPVRIRGKIKESGFQDMTMDEALANDGAKIDEYLDKVELYNRKLDRNKRQYFENQIEQAKRDGYDGIVFRETEDQSIASTGAIGDPAANVYAIFSPKNIRSKFAKFDPAKKNSANLLAGGAAAAVGVNALMRKDRDEYVTR